MRGFRNRRKGDAAVDLNVIPLIDVVFFLLVFYVISTSFAPESAVEVDRPSSAGANAVSGAFVPVAITKAGAMQIGERVVDLAGLPDAVAVALREHGTEHVVVVPDREVPTGLLLQVMDACHAGGATAVDVAALREGR
jgi:biopolymer transport protein ExbD